MPFVCDENIGYLVTETNGNKIARTLSCEFNRLKIVLVATHTSFVYIKLLPFFDFGWNIKVFSASGTSLGFTVHFFPCTNKGYL